VNERIYDIIGIGDIAVDDTLHMPCYPAADSKTRILSRKRQGGGRISCALAAAARLGSPCAILGRLGDGNGSAFTRKYLGEELGVDLSLMLHDPACGPTHSTIIVAADTGSRAVFIDHSIIKPLAAEELKPEWFAAGSVLLVDSLNPPCILEAVKLARQAGMIVVSDIERDSPQYLETRHYIDHLVHGSEFALSYTQTKCPADACKALADSSDHETTVVTAGGRGCYWRTRGEDVVHHHPAYKIRPVDTTGCGDVFHGVFCCGVAQSWPIEKTIEYATAAAAIKATRFGGWLTVPTLDEIQELIHRPEGSAGPTP
jgi:sugar/nucleoside kinase (ribokinase family)